MNSEELELSLRTEFESYLKEVLAGVRQDVSDIQKNFEAEFEKHKSQMDEAFRSLSTRFESNFEFDESFTQSVVEHLRLARDDGATITAAAIGEAEKLSEAAAPPVKFDKLRDAINEITAKTSQSEILKSLVEHAAEFTPRGAFFIVKNDHFVGWKVFGEEADAEDGAVRDTYFPASADTILADAIASLSTKDNSEGGHAEDALFLDPVEFGRPDRMYAIPLIARGRGVAVLYADYGSEGVALNKEALETLVRVAGLTVELIAAAQPMPVQAPVSRTVEEREPVVQDMRPEESERHEPAAEQDTKAEVGGREEFITAAETDSIEDYAGAFSFEDSNSTKPSETVKLDEGASDYPAPSTAELENSRDADVPAHDDVPQPSSPFESKAEAEFAYFEPVAETEFVEPAFSEPAADLESWATETFNSDTAEPAKDDFSVEEYSPRVELSNGISSGIGRPAAEPAAQAVMAQTTRVRFGERPVDLPIEVSEDERRFHNDARRFARLLVSEIKLYNEQKVTEGRESRDLYDRLREAIDRSREMYEKRVQSPVAAKFDYFHYELVNSLAEGEDAKLGQSYPGASVR